MAKSYAQEVLDHLADGEEILIFSYFDPVNWCALTTLRLFCRAGSCALVLPWEAVADASIPQQDFDDLAVGALTSLDLHTLQIEGTDGQAIELQTVPGCDLLILWNAVLALAAGPSKGMTFSPDLLARIRALNEAPPDDSIR